MANYKSVYTGAEIDSAIGKANTALQEHQELKTINNESLIGEGNITIEGTSYTAGTNIQINEENVISATDTIYDDTEVRGLISDKQDELVSGTNIKTINGNSILGEGNLVIEGGQGGLTSVAHDATMTGAGTNESPLGVDTTTIAQKSDIPDISGKQDTLVSGTNIKTINNQSILGEGNIVIEGGSGTTDYGDLENKPKINNVELNGNKSLEDLGISGVTEEQLDEAIDDAVELCESDVVRTIGHINTNRFTPSLINDGVNISYANCTVSLDNDIFTFTSTQNAEIYFGNQVNTGGMYQSRFGTKIDVVGVDKLEFVISNNAFNKNYVSYFDTNNTCVGSTKFTTNQFFSLVPENAEYCIIRIGIDSSTIGAEYQTTLKVYDVGKVSLDEEINKLKDTQEKLINRFDDGIVNIPEFEIGNWQARDDGYIYQDSTTRIRSKRGSTVHLYVGDWVKITGPIRVYYGIYSDNTYSSVAWKNTDYIVTKEGDYQFLITAVPEATVINAEDLAKYFTVYRHESVPRNLVDIQNGRLTQVISCNHRGYNSVAPENTLPAYKRSAIEGFNYVETDVSVTSDGVYVLLHDDTINRTARNADGTEISEDVYINQITYAQALEYDFGIWKSQDYAGTKIPTFEQFIQLCRGLGVHPYIEIKRSNNFTEQQIHDLVDIVRDNGMINDVTWIEFSTGYSDLRTLVDYAPESRIGLVGSTPSVELVAKAKSLCTGQNEVFFNASVYDVTEENATICANAGIRLETWDSGNRSRFDDIYPYVKGFTTNTYIASRKLYDVYSV